MRRPTRVERAYRAYVEARGWCGRSTASGGTVWIDPATGEEAGPLAWAHHLVSLRERVAVLEAAGFRARGVQRAGAWVHVFAFDDPHARRGQLPRCSLRAAEQRLRARQRAPSW